MRDGGGKSPQYSSLLPLPSSSVDLHLIVHVGHAGHALAIPSANRFARRSSTTPESVTSQFSTRTSMSLAMRTSRIREPPRGWERLRWLGPGFLWMISAAGSGELLFTPRVGALYGYALLWALLGAVLLKWFINREIGRYTVSTGETILAGFRRLPGPRAWAVWLILIPQLVV